MSTEMKNVLNSIVNPNTGKTLNDEGRIVEIKADSSELLFKYKRDGITPDQKKLIENNIYEKVGNVYKQ